MVAVACLLIILTRKQRYFLLEDLRFLILELDETWINWDPERIDLLKVTLYFIIMCQVILKFYF